MLKRQKISITITIIIFIGLFITLLKISPTAGFYLVTIGILLGLIYAFIMTGLTMKVRVIIAVMTGITFIKHFSMMFHLPGASYYNLILVIPMGLFVYVSFKPNNLKTEYPFLLMTAITALFSFL